MGIQGWKAKFLVGACWFASVQLFQLSWTLSHPFLYIIAPYLLYSSLMGLQFGFIACFVEPEKMSRLSRIFGISALWTIMEWSRTFFLSGFAFNPAGMALAGNVYSIQLASIAGVFGLSFYVVLTNLFVLRAWVNRFEKKAAAISFVVVAIPYVFGFWQIQQHRSSIEKNLGMQALLVQTAFPVNEEIGSQSHDERLQHVQAKWEHIFQLIKKYQKNNLDLVALPEFVVPYGTYSFVYSYNQICAMVEDCFGRESLSRLPPAELPFAVWDRSELKVSNAFLSQTLANIFCCKVVVGLEDAQDIAGRRHYFSSAMLFEPLVGQEYRHQRYEKRILVPMGEYIPFGFFRNLAARYGVFGSFSPGEKAVVWGDEGNKFGVSICYEELFGDLIRESRVEGGQILLNITSDAWFPRSKLVRQHFEHARLRTVENGVSLLRACNTGITGCIDPLGRDVALLGENDLEREDLSGALFVNVPNYHYRTIYSKYGDKLIIAISLLVLLLFWLYRS